MSGLSALDDHDSRGLVENDSKLRQLALDHARPAASDDATCSTSDDDPSVLSLLVSEHDVREWRTRKASDDGDIASTTSGKTSTDATLVDESRVNDDDDVHLDDPPPPTGSMLDSDCIRLRTSSDDRLANSEWSASDSGAVAASAELTDALRRPRRGVVRAWTRMCRVTISRRGAAYGQLVHL